MKQLTEMILDVPVDLLTLEDIINDFPLYFGTNKKMTLTSINPQILLVSEKNETVKKFLIDSTHRFPDGIGVVKVSSWTKGQIKNRIAGIDVMEEVLEYAASHEHPVYFYGSQPEVLNQAVANIKKTYPALIVAGFTDGFTQKKEADLVKEINMSQAEVLFVALGSPKQEEWLSRNITSLHCSVFQTVGGSLDVKSGFSKRAPEIWIKLNMEWVYRSLSNPKRLYRIFQAPEFIIKSLSWHLKHKRVKR